MQLSCIYRKSTPGPSRRPALLLLGLLALLPASLCAGESPYFSTYDHHLEEPGDFEVSFDPIMGLPRTASGFIGATTEMEYGVKTWWTTEFYLDGQTTRRDSTLFTGWRWENRLRPLRHEHWINPVLYFEFEDINGADKSLKEIVGHDVQEDWTEPNDLAQRERKREIETKLILSSDYKGWNIAENFTAEKNLASEPWEFGYALGANRPLGLAASSQACNFCRENFRLGVEMFGGLGDWHAFGLANTSHYLAPIIAWELRNGTTLRLSPAFGLTAGSARALVRVGITCEFEGAGRRLRQMFR